MMINGVAARAKQADHHCQLHMRSVQDGDSITLEAVARQGVPVIRDLVVDRHR